jgi:hypothetical protein
LVSRIGKRRKSRHGRDEEIHSRKAGAECKNNSADVRALQQLLIAAGEIIKGGDSGKWDKTTAIALQSFQTSVQKQYPNLTLSVPIRSYVEPTDYVLLMMAWKGQMLIPLPYKRSWNGVKELHEWFVRNEIKYNTGADKGGGNRANYGVDKRCDYAIQSTNKRFARGPVQMDCTTYVILMLSIYLFGDAHNARYDADCSKFGGDSEFHCARDRYGYVRVNRSEKQGKVEKQLGYFTKAEQILTATEQDPDSLYVLEVGSPRDVKGKDKEGDEVTVMHVGGVTHMALLYNDRVYECTTHQPGAACIDRPVEKFMANKRTVYLFKPPS